MAGEEEEVLFVEEGEEVAARLLLLRPRREREVVEVSVGKPVFCLFWFCSFALWSFV